MDVQAVVFDLDGVIVQSMESHAAAYRQILTPLGIEISQRDVLLLEGARSETIIRDLTQAAGLSLSEEEILRMADAKQAAFHAGGLPPVYDGAEAMLEAAWHSDVTTAIVTGTRRTNLDALIPEWVDRFDALQTQETYAHDKPHPEPYANAARDLGVDPGACVAVENAIRGVASARAAGYGRVLAICTTLSADDLAAAGPDVIAADHRAMADALTDLLEGRS